MEQLIRRSGKPMVLQDGATGQALALSPEAGGNPSGLLPVFLAAGEAVEVSAWARLPAGSAPASVNLSVQRDLGGSASYEGVAGAAGTVTADTLTAAAEDLFRGTVIVGDGR